MKELLRSSLQPSHRRPNPNHSILPMLQTTSHQSGDQPLIWHAAVMREFSSGTHQPYAGLRLPSSQL